MHAISFSWGGKSGLNLQAECPDGGAQFLFFFFFFFFLFSCFYLFLFFFFLLSFFFFFFIVFFFFYLFFFFFFFFFFIFFPIIILFFYFFYPAEPGPRGRENWALQFDTFQKGEIERSFFCFRDFLFLLRPTRWQKTRCCSLRLRPTQLAVIKLAEQQQKNTAPARKVGWRQMAFRVRRSGADRPTKALGGAGNFLVGREGSIIQGKPCHQREGP